MRRYPIFKVTNINQLREATEQERKSLLAFNSGVSIARGNHALRQKINEKFHRLAVFEEPDSPNSISYTVVSVLFLVCIGALVFWRPTICFGSARGEFITTLLVTLSLFLLTANLFGFGSSIPLCPRFVAIVLICLGFVVFIWAVGEAGELVGGVSFALGLLVLFYHMGSSANLETGVAYLRKLAEFLAACQTIAALFSVTPSGVIALLRRLKELVRWAIGLLKARLQRRNLPLA